MPYAEVSDVSENPKNPEKPNDNCDDYYAIQYFLDLALHRNEAVHQPQQKTNDGQGNHNAYKRHANFPFISCMAEWNANCSTHDAEG